MLQATIRDSRGRVALLDGLGFSNTGVVQSSAEAMSSGRNAAAGGIVDTANATAADVAHNKGMPVAARGAGETACNIFHSSSVEAGTALATETPSQYTQGAAAAAARGTSFCSQVRPPRQSQPWANAASFVSPWAAPAVAARYQRQYNPFTVYTSDSPYLTTQGFGREAMYGEEKLTDEQVAKLTPIIMSVIGGFSEIPLALQMQTLGKLLSYYDEESQKKLVDAVVVAGGDVAVVNEAQTYAQDLLFERTKRGGDSAIWKKWWFWTALGGTALAAVGTATYFVRKSR